MKKNKVFKVTLISLIVILLVADLGGAGYLFKFAFQRGEYSSRKITTPIKGDNKWFANQKQQIWTETNKDGLKLKARYLSAAKKTNKTVIVIHGYNSASKYMGDYVKPFHDAGYNVLAPDNRSFGMSQGKFVGYGWADRHDIMQWMQKINQHNGKNSQIGLYGLSMGASEVMYTLGEHPKNVKFAIADCGYASISGELNYQINAMFHLPSFPLVPTASIYSKMFAGYNFYDADTKNTLKHNKVPLYVIQGSNDKYVPTKNAKINYDNDKGANKQLWIVKGAGHAQSIKYAPGKYQRNITAFAHKYL